MWCGTNSEGRIQMVTKSERFWVSHRNALGVTLLANLFSGSIWVRCDQRKVRRERRAFHARHAGNAGHPPFRMPPGHAGSGRVIPSLGGILLSVSEEQATQATTVNL